MSTGIDCTKKHESRLLQLLDLIPEEIRILHILPYLSPQTLVWLNKSNYIAHHSSISPLITYNRSTRFPLGKYETYVRHMVRIDASFVVTQLLKENRMQWQHRGYYYQGNNFRTFLHFISQYSIDHNASRCRKAIQVVGCEALGRNWHKGKRARSSKWSN